MSSGGRGADINLWGVLWVALALLVSISGVWMVPYVVLLIPWRVETRLAQLMRPPHLGAECDVSAEPAWHDLLQLTARLYPQSLQDREAPLTVHLVDSPQVNAFASLGGEIYILTGLIDHLQSPDELAGVLAHELEHISRRHLLRHLADSAALTTVLLLLLGDDSAAGSMAKSADYWSALHFSRAQEAEADRGGVRRMRQAGISLQGLMALFTRMDDGVPMLTWASDHPGFSQRQQALEAMPTYPSTPALSWSQWQRLKALQHCNAAVAPDGPQEPRP